MAIPGSVRLSAAASALLVFAVFPAGAGPEPGLDLHSLLYSSQVTFANGVPQVTIMLMEGQDFVTVSSQSALRVAGAAEGGAAEAVPGVELTARLRSSRPARTAWRAVVSEMPFSEKEKRREAEALWAGRGFETRTFTIGSVFGITGKVYDNRTYVVTVATGGDENRDSTVGLSSELYRKYNVRIAIFPEVLEMPSGEIEVVDGAGKAVGTFSNLVSFSPGEAGSVMVKRVEHGKGYAWHGWEDRRFAGEIIVTLDRAGKLAVINSIGFEELIKGLVPSEIFPKAPREALRAQAVAARSEILSKIGHRHPGNPYLLCAEQHCQVYSGLARDTPATTEAVESTRGEVIAAGGRIVGAVYSSNCGGHTEDNNVAWEMEPDPALRGRIDADDGSGIAARWQGLGTDEKKLSEWLDSRPRTWCELSSYGRKDVFRWKKAISAGEMNRLVAKRYKVGRVLDIKVVGRGSSGRVTGVKVIGSRSSAYVGREFNVRQLFGGLKSGMFVLEIFRDRNGKAKKFVFRGGGWGHGVGMCQIGATGMAEAGKGYREILMHYFTGASIDKAYQ